MPIMGGSTEAMNPETTAGETGIATATGTETGTGTGIGDTTDETTHGNHGTTIVQTVLPQIEGAMVPGTVTGAVGMTTEEKETGSEGGVGTARISVPEIANMTDDMFLRPIVLHHYPPVAVSPLSLILVHGAQDALDHHHEPHSPPRRGPPTHPSRGRRSTSPRSMGNRSRRSSPLSRARLEPADTHPPRDIPRPPNSPSPRRASPSPNQYPRSVSSPARPGPERQSPETAGRQLRRPDEPYREGGSASVKVEDHAVVLDVHMDVEMATEPLDKGKDRSDNREGELHVKAESPRRTGSPTECQQQLIPSLETVTVSSSDVAVTQPYLPTIPRYDAKPRFSAAYESEASLFDQDALIDSSRCLFLV